MNIQQKLVNLRNKIKEQKIYSGLTYSQLLLPENTPQLTYSSTVSLGDSIPLARVRFRFTRDDDLTDPPMINFAYNTSISPTYKEFAQSNGFVFSADDNDLSYIDRGFIYGYIAQVGDGYVDFYVEVDTGLKSSFFSLNSMSFSVTCQAIVNVKGTLTVERLI